MVATPGGEGWRPYWTQAWCQHSRLRVSCPILCRWSGTWKLQAYVRNNALSITIAHDMCLSLHAGESIRSFRILLTPYNGDEYEGFNAHRHLVLDHIAPRDQSGQLVQSPISSVRHQLGGWHVDVHTKQKPFSPGA